MMRKWRLLIFCSSWMYTCPDVDGWEIFCNIQETDPRFSKKAKFGPEYVEVIKRIKPDFVVAVNVGCSEKLFDQMHKPSGLPTKYITWSTDSYRHTRRAKTSDLHLTSIPDESVDPERDHFVPLFFDTLLPVIPLNKRAIMYGLNCRIYNLARGFRQKEIKKLKNFFKNQFYVNQSNIPPQAYLNEVRQYKFGFNIPVYPDGLPNFRSFELGALGVMPIVKGLNNDLLDDLFLGHVVTYNSLDEIPEKISLYDPVKIQKFYNLNHSLRMRLNYIFRKYFDVKFGDDIWGRKEFKFPEKVSRNFDLS